jgi:hypothetical protein
MNWQNKIISLDSSQLLTKELLIKYINIFWLENQKELDNKHLLLILRLKFDNGQIVSLGQMKRLNKEDMQFYIDYLLDIIETKTDPYFTTPISQIIFSFGYRDGRTIVKFNKIKHINVQKYYNNKLPIAFNPIDYGQVLIHNNNLYIIKIDKKTLVIIKQFNDETGKYNLVDFFKNNSLLYTWKDTYLNENKFIREIGKSVYTIEDNEIILHKVVKPVKFINNIKKSRKS